MSYRLQTAALSAQPQQFPGVADEDYGKSAVGGPPPPTRFFKCLLGLVCLFFLLLLIIVIVFVIVCNPKMPAINADYLHITNLTLANTTISGTFTFQFSVFNLNRVITVNYQTVNASVYFKTAFIGSTKLDDLKLGTKETSKTSEAKVTVDSAQLSARKINDINWERNNRGFVYFNLELKAKLLQSQPVLADDWSMVTAKCQGMEVVMGPNSIDGATRKDAYRGCQIILY